MADPESTTDAFASHDHTQCRDTALAEAERQCARAGLRLTEIRRRVLEVLLESHRALGAYDVLDRLKEEGRAAQPPVAYRALDFLVANGFAHRIESLNAFVACVCPEATHRPAFLICRGCRKVAEAPAAPAKSALSEMVGKSGFVIERLTIEAQGICPACAKDAAPCP